MLPNLQSVLVTGGAGYVGSSLTPKLLSSGKRVVVLDLYMYGEDIFAEYRDNPNLVEIKGDIRHLPTVERALQGVDAVIHLACISNDPSYDLDPKLGKSINFDCFRPLVKAAKRAKVKRFIYASSSSVYGVKEEDNVTEDLPLEPLTDYSKFKAQCEKILAEERQPGFAAVTLRPSTVCGYAKRLRLDLTVNILANHAINNHKITVFGGGQKRPNIHIEDMTDLYLHVLALPDDLVDGKIFNAGFENYTVMDIAKTVRDALGMDVEIVVTPTDDNRSYHVSSEKMRRELGFQPRFTIADAARDLKQAFAEGKIPNPMTDPRYYNIKVMQKLGLK